jgi:AraC family transcriptional regulator of adaptative response/methylated-DNA-[protein]-cysteine methyltransferase
VREAARAIAAGQRPRGDTRRLTRAFKRVLGITTRAYAEAGRVERFKRELKRRKQVSPALYEAGYGSTSRVYERADAQLGMTPAKYAKGGAGVGIAYITVSTPLGLLLVAATERGVCRVALADNAGILEQDLLAEFPHARIVADKSGKIHGWVSAILSYLEQGDPIVDLPLDIRATAFQRRVWQELQKIPFGQTRTYAEVARRIGNPKATRAVAQACSSNPVALVIPCHRVVSKNGEIGGYRWGVERKKTLIARESSS